MNKEARERHNSRGVVKVYFNRDGVALGKNDDRDYSFYCNDYFASEVFRLNVGTSVEGLTFNEIKNMESAQRN